MDKDELSFDNVQHGLLNCFIDSQVVSTLKNFIGDYNDYQTRQRVKFIIESFLNEVKERKGLDSFEVICDETNNTPESISKCELSVDVTRTWNLKYVSRSYTIGQE